MPPTLQRLFTYLGALGKSFEIVVVDDGSKDGTAHVIREVQQTHPELVLLADGKNRGRAFTVKRGVLHARGEFILETDADGSVDEEAIGRFLHTLEQNPALAGVFGSREMDGSHKALHQPPLRVFLGYGFIYLAKAIFWMWSITDPALGFKLFRHDAAQDIFEHQYEPYVIAEAELVFIAHQRGHKFVELPVTWTDNADSRIRPIREVFRSFLSLTRIRLRGFLGKYR